jgi:hypothetical protein
MVQINLLCQLIVLKDWNYQNLSMLEFQNKSIYIWCYDLFIQAIPN